MNTINSRYLAYKILYEIETKKTFSTEVIDRYFSTFEIDQRDKSLVNKIVYGILENKFLLDYYIENISSTDLKKIDQEILIILRIGIYQILFLDKIPDSAAVNEAVKVTKKVNFKAKGFVNGVLRNFLRKKESITLDNLNGEEHLRVKYSHPKWLINYYKNNIEDYAVENILKFNNSHSDQYIRVNTLKITRDELINRLKENNAICEPSTLTKDGVRIINLNGFDLVDNELFEDGLFYIQDDASILVSEILAPAPGEFIIDTCASPGGKTTHIAQLMKNKGHVLARDVSKHKLNFIEENLQRLAIEIVDLEVFDATEEDLDNYMSADRVLVDAPCSGLGIINKLPDIRYNKTPSDLDDLSDLQYKILENSSKLVKEQGTLVYSTCTVGPKENIEVIEKFLYNNKDFRIEQINKEDFLQIIPGKQNTDGFFICKLTRQSR